MDYSEIENRYGKLAGLASCLSCGSALNHSGASEGEVCVDLGSGRGTDVIRLAEIVGEKGFVYGVDISEGMIHKAQRTAERLDVKNVRFIHCPLEEIDLEDDIASLVISNCTINHSMDKPSVWNQIFRILKAGGRLVISDIYSLVPVPEEFRNDPLAVAECWAGAVTREEYLNHLTKAGFVNIRIIEESDPYLKGQIRVSSWTVSGEKS